MAGLANRTVSIRGATVPLNRPNDRAPMLAGIAHTYGTTPSSPFVDENGREVIIRLLPGSFDAHLKAVNEWRAPGVWLLINHDWKQGLCCTNDGSLMVWSGAKKLCFTVNPQKKAGRRAIDVVRARRDLRECSVGAYTLLSKAEERPGQLPLMSVAMCGLREISLVNAGRYERTRAIVARNANQGPQPSHLERGQNPMNGTMHPTEERALRALHAAESGMIQTGAVDERAIAALVAGGLAFRAGGRVLLTAAGRARAIGAARGSSAPRELAQVAWRC